MRGRREKLFGYGRPIPLDRNAKARITVLARALSRRTEAGKAYGVLTAKFLAVLQALLWGFHNARDGRCYPSYEAIAERAGCARSTVYEAIRALEEAGILTWVNRITRVREVTRDLFGKVEGRWRVLRTSNAYAFTDPGSRPAAGPPKPSKSDFQTGTPGPFFRKKEASQERSPASRLAGRDKALAELRARYGAIVDAVPDAI
jgi:hypothetical protein